MVFWTANASVVGPTGVLTSISVGVVFALSCILSRSSGLTVHDSFLSACALISGTRVIVILARSRNICTSSFSLREVEVITVVGWPKHLYCKLPILFSAKGWAA